MTGIFCLTQIHPSTLNHHQPSFTDDSRFVDKKINLQIKCTQGYFRVVRDSGAGAYSTAIKLEEHGAGEIQDHVVKFQCDSEFA